MPFIQIQLEKRAETTQARQDLGAHGAFDRRFDSFDQFGSGVNIDTGVAIGKIAIRRLLIVQ